MKEAPDGYEIQVGDIITSDNFMGITKWPVHRVTKLYCFVKYNDIAEGKFPRKYGWAFQSLPRQKWNTTRYKVYTK